MKKVFQAIQKVAMDFGIKEIAEIIQGNADRLRKKFNPNDEYHQLTLGEFIHTTAITGNPAGLIALNAEFGYLCIKAPKATDQSSMNQMCFLTMMLELGQSKGDLSAAFKKALADGRICVNDVEQINQAIYEVECDLAEMKQAMEICLKSEKQGSR